MKKLNKPLKLTKAHKEKKIKQAILMLNDVAKLKIAPSQIHGVGVFVTRDVKKDDKLYADAISYAFDVPFSRFNELKKDTSEILLNYWPQIATGSQFIYPVTKMTAFINHSDKPNYDARQDKVLIDIALGEEVTVDYKSINNWETIFSWLK